MRATFLCILFSGSCLFATAPYAQTTAPALEKQELENSESEAAKQLPWEVCNETSFIQEVATATIATSTPGTPMLVKGWTKLYPGTCQAVEAAKGTPRFVYARSASVHQGGIREWNGQHDYCVSDEDFEAKTDISCALQNMKPRKFLRVIPTEYRTAFVEPEDFGKKASTAGLQRLLQDNNYDVKRVDGLSGKRTTNTLNKFLKDNETSTDISIEEKYVSLEKHAREIQDKIGVTLCNESKARVWGAIAYENGDEVESRGWWPVETGTCLRPFSESLTDRQVHFYARQENGNLTDKILKVSSKSAKDLCVGEAKFSAIRQEFCEDQGYITARFHSLPIDQTGARIILKDGNFADAVISGLRQ
jgi:uncharacterized membrane protein